MRTSDADRCRHKSPVTASSHRARSTRIGDGRKIGLTSSMLVTSCHKAISTTNATTLIHVRCSNTKPPPRKLSFRSRAAPCSAATFDSDMRHQLAIGHDRLLFDQRPQALAELRHLRLMLRLHALGARDGNRDDL